MEKPEPNVIITLPREIWIHIFSFLPRGLLQYLVANVCSDFYRVIKINIRNNRLIIDITQVDTAIMPHDSVSMTSYWLNFYLDLCERHLSKNILPLDNVFSGLERFCTRSIERNLTNATSMALDRLVLERNKHNLNEMPKDLFFYRNMTLTAIEKGNLEILQVLKDKFNVTSYSKYEYKAALRSDGSILKYMFCHDKTEYPDGIESHIFSICKELRICQISRTSHEFLARLTLEPVKFKDSQ